MRGTTVAGKRREDAFTKKETTIAAEGERDDTFEENLD